MLMDSRLTPFERRLGGLGAVKVMVRESYISVTGLKKFVSILLHATTKIAMATMFAISYIPRNESCKNPHLRDFR